MLLQIVEAQLENKNFNTPLPPTTAGQDASPAFFYRSVLETAAGEFRQIIFFSKENLSMNMSFSCDMSEI
jgi:hypothetical protein